MLEEHNGKEIYVGKRKELPPYLRDGWLPDDAKEDFEQNTGLTEVEPDIRSPWYNKVNNEDVKKPENRLDTTTTDAKKKAKHRLNDFEALLAGYDHDAVAQLHDAISESTIAHLKTPDLTVDEWIKVLEQLAGEVYLSAFNVDRTVPGPGHETRWVLRHDGEALIYGTKEAGELYRGESAEQQVTSVIENHNLTPYPMSLYPIEQENGDGFVKNNPKEDT
jgi:hypothetical protein